MRGLNSKGKISCSIINGPKISQIQTSCRQNDIVHFHIGDNTKAFLPSIYLVQVITDDSFVVSPSNSKPYVYVNY